MQFHKHGKIVGELKDGIYRKVVSKRRHLMRNLNAWGISSSIMDKLSEMGCIEIRIKDKDTGVIYSISLLDFMTKGTTGYYAGESQYFAPLHLWKQSMI